MKKQLKLKRIVQFLCLSGASIIYYVPYMIGLYYDTFQAATGATDIQLGVIQSAYTTMTIATYFLGGLLADRISSKTLLSLSYLATGLLAVFVGFFPSYTVMVILFGAMGITTTLTFWAALIKATRIFAKAGGEGTALASMEGTRNVLSSIVSTVALILFGVFADKIFGLRIVIYIFAGMNVLIGLLIHFIFDRDTVEKPEGEGVIKILLSALKDPNVWLMSFIILGVFATNVNLRYITPYATSMFGLSALGGAILGNFREYMRPVGSYISALVGDRFGISKSIIVMTLLLAAFNFGLPLLPTGAANVIGIFVGGAMGYILIGAVRGLYFATQSEAKMPLFMAGTVTGILSTIGFLPDSFLPIINGNIIQNNDPSVCYGIIFNISGAFALFACVIAIIFHIRNKENIKELKAIRLARIAAEKEEASSSVEQ